jgi:hypothetical protein
VQLGLEIDLGLVGVHSNLSNGLGPDFGPVKGSRPNDFIFFSFFFFFFFSGPARFSFSSLLPARPGSLFDFISSFCSSYFFPVLFLQLLTFSTLSFIFSVSFFSLIAEYRGRELDMAAEEDGCGGMERRRQRCGIGAAGRGLEMVVRMGRGSRLRRQSLQAARVGRTGHREITVIWQLLLLSSIFRVFCSFSRFHPFFFGASPLLFLEHREEDEFTG